MNGELYPFEVGGHGLIHFLGTGDINSSDAEGCVEVDGATDQADIEVSAPNYDTRSYGGVPVDCSQPATEVNVGLSNNGAPTLSLSQQSPLTVDWYSTFETPVATATDDVDGDISHLVQVSGTVDTTILGSTLLTYDVTDSAGNAATPLVLTVIVLRLDLDDDEDGMPNYFENRYGLAVDADDAMDDLDGDGFQPDGVSAGF